MRPDAPSVAPSTPPARPASEKGATVWSTLLGAIAIVFALGGCLAAIVTITSTFFMDSLVDMVRTFPNVSAQTIASIQTAVDFSREWRPLMVGLALIRAALAAVLFTGGILLIRRHRSSVRILWIWALLQFLLVMASIGAGLVAEMAALEVMTAARSGATMAAVAVAGAALRLVWGLILPAFILIWFARKPIREQTETWI